MVYYLASVLILISGNVDKAKQEIRMVNIKYSLRVIHDHKQIGFSSPPIYLSSLIRTTSNFPYCFLRGVWMASNKPK